jgi:hypothetical protein
MPPVTTLMRPVRADVEAAISPDNSREISSASTFSNAREVIMTMREYEERFRPPAPSLSNLRGGPGPQPGRKAESTPLGYGCLIRCNDDNI